jgi:hypothetical protein
MDAAVDIRPTYSAMGFASEAAPVRASVNGHGPFQLGWKQVGRIPVPSGQVTIVVWSSWVTKKFMGTSSARIEVRPGEVVGLEWKMPGSVFTAGKLTVAVLDPPTYLPQLAAAEVPGDEGKLTVTGPQIGRPLAHVPLVGGGPAAAAAVGAAQAPAPAGAWHPDPTGRFAHRWWDGTAWTDVVSDGTTTSSDPLPGA